MKRSITAKMIGCLVLAVGFCLAPSAFADRPFDPAIEALRRGIPAAAIELYAPAFDDAPTVEIANNLGLALEQGGRFREAADAYRVALYVTPGSPAITHNLRRVRMRAWLRRVYPFALGFSAACLAATLLCGVIRLFTRSVRRMRHAWRLGRVRVISFTHRISDADGAPQPDGRFHYDSEALNLSATVLLPEHPSIYPLHFCFTIRRPGDVVLVSNRQSVDAPGTGRIDLRFETREMSRLLACPGDIGLELTLENNEKRIGIVQTEVVPRAGLVKDLELTLTGLASITPDGVVAGDTVLTDSISVIPTFRFKPRTYPVEKYSSLTMGLELTRCQDGRRLDAMDGHPALESGELEFPSVCRAVAGTDLGEEAGTYEFALTIDDLTVARRVFSVVTAEEALRGIELDSIRLAGMGRGGNAFPLQDRVYRSRVRALIPMIDFRAAHPTPRIRGKVSIAVMQGEDMLTALETETIFDTPRVSMTPAALELDDLPIHGRSATLQFVLLLNEQYLGEASVCVRESPPPCADAQGCLVRDVSFSDRDLEDETLEIMQEAVVR